MSLHFAPRAPIFLIGFMGAGKTTVGGLLANRLNRSFVDLDDRIAQDAGLQVALIFAHQGEENFRRLETKALKEAAKQTWSVIATGGGAVCKETNLHLMLRTGPVITLAVSAAEALRRTGKKSGRPLLDGSPDPVAAAERLLLTRAKFYAKAPLRVNTDRRRPQEIVNMILADLGPDMAKKSA